MLCAGSIRAKNVKNVILWNLLDSCGGGLAYWAVGYAFAYGGDKEGGPKTFIGNSNFFLWDDRGTNYENWFFQFAFACALSSIVAGKLRNVARISCLASHVNSAGCLDSNSSISLGTIAERTKMMAYLMYSVFLVGFVYPVVSN
jgi:Amt family ammonium transporter